MMYVMNAHMMHAPNALKFVQLYIINHQLT